MCLIDGISGLFMVAGGRAFPASWAVLHLPAHHVLIPSDGCSTLPVDRCHRPFYDARKRRFVRSKPGYRHILSIRRVIKMKYIFAKC